MKKSLKSQVTMLMIIGLVMFIVVGIVLYISKGAVKKISQQSVKKTQDTITQNQPLKEFVVGCVDKLAKDSLVLLGQQGGYIYTDQGGTLIKFIDSDEGRFFIKNKGIKVAYNIRNPPIYLPSPYSAFLPDYPWIIFPYKQDLHTKTFEGIFGVSITPFLNYSGPQSIQNQIEEFIDNNLDTCLDFSTFKSQGYEIEVQKSKTKITIGSTDISVKSEIPLKILNTATKEVLEIKDFSDTINVRLKDIYYFIQDLIYNDIQNITFDIKDPKNDKNSFYIKVIENAYKSDDLIVVKDEKSLIYGQPLEYVFARQNRPPALYYILNNELEFPENYIITRQDLLQDYDLKAEDPDEDHITYDVKALLPDPSLPTKLDRPYIQFVVSASDGEYTDYQVITARRT